MPQENSQMSPQEAKASLGVATNLQDQLLGPKQPQNTESASKTSKEPPKDEKGIEAKVELDLSKKFDELAKEIKDNQKTEMENIRLTIQQALADEDDPQGEQA